MTLPTRIRVNAPNVIGESVGGEPRRSQHKLETGGLGRARAMNAYGLFSFRNHVRPGQPAQRLGLSLTK